MRHTGIWISILAVIFFVSGCMSLPPPSDEYPSLLVIDRDYSRTTHLDPYLKYHLYVDGGNEPYMKFDASDQFLVVKGLGPGPHTIKKIVAVMDNNEGEWVIRNSNIRFELNEGEATVLNMTFVVLLEQMKDESTGSVTWYSEDMTIVPLSDERRQNLIEAFADRDKDGNWTIR